MNRLITTAVLVSAMTGLSCLPIFGANVRVEMNTVSTTMRLHSLSTDEDIETGNASSRIYNFEADPGEYILTAYATNGTTENGRIKLTITDSEETQTFKILTCTVYATNKNSDNTTWLPEKDFNLELEIISKEGEIVDSQPGISSTAGRLTFLALNGNSYFASIIPSSQHEEEGYMPLYKGGTLTFNSNIYGAIPLGGEFHVNVAEGTELALGIKFTHFTKFREIQPLKVENSEEGKTYTYRLANSQIYNYRAWKAGGLTHAGYFTMNTDETQCPSLSFTEEDFGSISPKEINHSVDADDGYETGDIFVNINPQGYLRMEKGETFTAHAMRSWQLTDSATGNYFMEPDFHYTILNVDGSPSEGVIEIENADTSTNPWSTIKAIGEGTAIVLVNYDGIAVNYYSGADKKNYMGGQNWGACWPENTAVFIVTVGMPESIAISNMFVNEGFVTESSKLSGNHLDAECDVVYFKEQEGHGYFTFAPDNTSSITVANPNVTNQKISYSGFSNDGVEVNTDGSYTVKLTEGRNIICLEDIHGGKTYQVITAKPCSYVIYNETDPGNQNIFPGDQVRIQFTGLRHPANKLAGIYNMSAYAYYNEVPYSSTLGFKANQYKFGSTATAQAITLNIPDDYNPLTDDAWEMKKGTIVISGYGDPIGSHRNISETVGRAPNFTAIAHKTSLGILPDIVIPVTTNGIISAVEDIDSDQEIIDIISPDGIHHKTLQHGINIIRYSDGTVKKLIKKSIK
ncbi:MAG: hypothetical protein K2M31_09945 [Muribaculaceae bacterium]|nr:hypothetical protein [Muribaculaceae bacterium]